MFDKPSALALGVTATISAGVGYLLAQNAATIRSSESPSNEDEVERLIRPNILALTPYRCARDDYDSGILLDANENSLGPCLGPNNEFQQLQLERYPCPYQKDLKQALADYRNAGLNGDRVKTENIFLGVGSDEAIDLIIRVACTPRVDTILITPPTYGMYQVCANIHDVGIISVPLEVDAPAENPRGLLDGHPLPSFHINPQKILAAVQPSTKIIFLCSPGNPTANALRLEDILTVLESPKYKGLVVVDEAYIDFSETSQSLCTMVNQHRRLVVLQTLSKAFGLAGVRLGSAFGDPKLIQVLNNVKAPYNINKLTAKVAGDALGRINDLSRKIDVIKEEKDRVIRALRQFPFVKAIYASDSNFVLFEIPKALQVYREMANRGVVIRYRGNQLLLNDCLRATIGSKAENDSMLQLLAQVVSELK
ncbi:hypothetical protein PINS_up003565 [Pythium insidiosum]|nr:hypothetical protein PINS_up003565 [Pythium insidiosum]